VQNPPAAQPGGQNFKCPQCGGGMFFDAASQALKCQYCNHTMQQPAIQMQGGGAPPPGLAVGPREIPLSEGLARAPKGLGTQMQSIQCKDCGATVNLAPNEQTVACTYCASHTVIAVASDPNLIMPESLVPFQITKEQAKAKFKEWLGGLWFRPNNLKKASELDQMHGVYVPYWTFDSHVYSQWQADRGWYYYETESYEAIENGQTVWRTREVQRVRWEPAWGTRQDFYDDVLVCGSKGLPTGLADQMTSFNTQSLVLYNPSYLAGWRAESYAVDLQAAWPFAQQKIDSQQVSKCAGDIGGDTHQNLHVQNQYTGQTFKHVLLPVFVAAYRYQNKPYQLLVNGQTGEVVGKAPYSVWKILALILVIVGIAVAGYLIWASQNGDSSRRMLRGGDSPAAIEAVVRGADESAGYV